VLEFLVTDFVKATGTLTFTPATTAITTENYFIRKSYKGLADRASRRVREDIGAQGHPAYLLIDSTQANRLIVLKALEMYFQQLRSATDDKFDLQFKHYQSEYKEQLAGIPLQMDIDDDGAISDEEAKGNNFASIRLSR
jgi:hypothetical protein